MPKKNPGKESFMDLIRSGDKATAKHVRERERIERELEALRKEQKDPDFVEKMFNRQGRTSRPLPRGGK